MISSTTSLWEDAKPAEADAEADAGAAAAAEDAPPKGPSPFEAEVGMPLVRIDMTSWRAHRSKRPKKTLFESEEVAPFGVASRGGLLVWRVQHCQTPKLSASAPLVRGEL